MTTDKLGGSVQWTNPSVYGNQIEKPGTGEVGGDAPTVIKGETGDVEVRQTKTEHKKIALGTGDRATAKTGETKSKIGIRDKIKRFFTKATPAEKEAKAAKKLEKAMAKIKVSAPEAGKVQSRTSTGGMVFAAKEFMKDGGITDEILFASETELSANQLDRRESLRSLIQNGKAIYDEVKASDPKLAEEFKKDLCAVVDAVSKRQAAQLRGKIEHQVQLASVPNSTADIGGALSSIHGNFLRNDTIDTTMFSKLGGFNAFSSAADSILKEIQDDPELCKLLEQGKKNESNLDEGEKVEFTKEQADKLKAFVDKSINTLANPDSIDKDLAKSLGKRYDAMYKEVLEALKNDKTLSEMEKKVWAKKLATASVHNELALRWMNPAMAAVVTGVADPNVRDGFVSLMKAIQTACNHVSGSFDLTREDLQTIKDNNALASKATFLIEMTTDSIDAANDAFAKMTESILAAGREE